MRPDWKRRAKAELAKVELDVIGRSLDAFRPEATTFKIWIRKRLNVLVPPSSVLSQIGEKIAKGASSATERAVSC